MYPSANTAEPSPMIRLERLRTRLRAEHLADLDATPGPTPRGCGRRDLVAEALAAVDAAIHEDLGSRPDAELDARMVAVTALADRFWEHDGPTDTDNGALVGPAIHHLVHDREFTLERAGPRGYRLTAPDGRTWTSHITATGIAVTTNF